ncbi:MAG: flagellar assembly protein FliW [Geminicoccaceae bacterium]|nr:flagellar assembly protein FliW [Geminicoccaceae bacterium]
MLGFDHLSLFHLSPLSDEPSEFRLLQSVEDPDVGFVVMSLKDKDFYLDHAPDARAGDASLDDIEIMNVVNIDKDSNGADFYVNLRAPLFFNRKSRVAKQVVLNDSKYPIRLKILK